MAPTQYWNRALIQKCSITVYETNIKEPSSNLDSKNSATAEEVNRRYWCSPLCSSKFLGSASDMPHEVIWQFGSECYVLWSLKINCIVWLKRNIVQLGFLSLLASRPIIQHDWLQQFDILNTIDINIRVSNVVCDITNMDSACNRLIYPSPEDHQCVDYCMSFWEAFKSSHGP